MKYQTVLFPAKQNSYIYIFSPTASAYKFGSSSSVTTAGGFKFGPPNQSSGSISTGSPFKSGTGSITSATQGGFKFGAQTTTSSSSESKQDFNPFKTGQSADDSAKSSSTSASSGFKFGNSATTGGFKIGGASSSLSTNDKESAAPPPNADPFKSGAFSAPKTTKPTDAVPTATSTATDSAPSAAKVTSAPSTNLQFNIGGATSKTDSAPSVNFSTGNSGTTEPKTTFNFGGPKSSASENQSATANSVFKFGGNAAAAATTTEQKDSSSKAAFQFGKPDTSTAASASDSKSIFGGNQSQQPTSSLTNATTEQSASKPMFNFKNSTTNTSFQFGADTGSNSGSESNVTSQASKPAGFNFTGSSATAESKPTFNFGGASKTATENKGEFV